MPAHLILKLRDDELPEVVDLVTSEPDADPSEEIKRGYRDDGRYAIIEWEGRTEATLCLGPVEAADVEDQAARTAKAEEAAQVEPDVLAEAAGAAAAAS